MVATAFFTRPIRDNENLCLENLTMLRVIVDENNTERVLLNSVPILNRVEEILIPDGTFCPELHLDIRFESGLLPTTTPIKQIYLQYRKLIQGC